LATKLDDRDSNLANTFNTQNDILKKKNVVIRRPDINIL